MAEIEHLYDQEQVHTEIVKRLEGKYDIELVDNLNSFAMMLESIGETGAAYLQATTTATRKVYPTTCDSFESILRHATNDELIGLYATPSDTTITFFISGVDILENGLQSDIGDSKVVTMTSGTRVKVGDLTFTTLNDIRIHYDGDNSVVEQTSVNDYGFNRYGSLKSYIVTDNHGGRWIKFEAHLRQYDYEILSFDITGHFDTYIDLKGDQLWFLTADAIYEDRRLPMIITHSDIVYTQDTPTLRVSVLEDRIRLTLPNIYNLVGNQPSSIELTLNTTKGNININLSEYVLDEFTIHKSSDDLTLMNVTVNAFSTSVVTGGSDRKSIEEVRRCIIDNVTGALLSPVTISQLREKSLRDGYDINLYSDMTTHRLFTIGKNLPTNMFNTISSEPDIYLNKSILNPDTINYKIDYSSSGVVVKQDTLFESKNGIIKPVTDELLLDTFRGSNGMSRTRLIEYLRDHKIFYTPFTNIIYKDYVCRTVRLDAPIMDNLEIVNRNVFIPYRINIDDYKISFKDDEYLISISLTNIDSINTSTYPVKAQLIIPTANGGKLYFNSDGIVDGTVNVLVFKIPTDSFVNEDDNIRIIGGSSLYSTLVPLRVESQIMIYAIGNIVDNTNVYEDESYLSLPNGIDEITGITNQSIRIEFGQPLDNLFNNTSFQYTERKYKRYESDIPYFYENDVYAFELSACSEDEPDMTIVHRRGDMKRAPQTAEQLISGDEGSPLLRYMAGDTILIDGLPIVDEVQGVDIHTNMLMLEFEYKIIRNRIYDDSIDLVKEHIKQFLGFCDIIGENRLESTAFKYKPFKNSGTVLIDNDGVKLRLNQYMRPTLELYVDINSDFTLDIREIGRVIQQEIQKDRISLDDIRKAIKNTLGITAVSIKDLGIDYDSEYIHVIGNQFSLTKKLTQSDEVVYDMDVSIVRV